MALREAKKTSGWLSVENSLDFNHSCFRIAVQTYWRDNLVPDCVCNCHHLQNHSKKFVLGGAECGKWKMSSMEEWTLDSVEH